MHIQYYLSGNCFGDHFTRAGIDLRTRELLTFSTGFARRLRTSSEGARVGQPQHR
jgi:alkylhydroperoxidase/carboxymuconolactone decarboxylase family protein YurZ